MSVKEGGHLGVLKVGADIRTTGDTVVSLEVLGTVDHLDISGRVLAEGEGSDAAHTTRVAAALLDGVEMAAPRGRTLVRVDQGA